MLPFTDLADIQDQAGETLLEGVPFRMELAATNSVRVGVSLDYIADVHAMAANDLLGQVNRRLVVNNRNFKVVSCEFHDFIPHLEVGLKEVRGG